MGNSEYQLHMVRVLNYSNPKRQFKPDNKFRFYFLSQGC